MKKLIMLLMTALLITVFSGCSEDQPENTEQSSDTLSSVTDINEESETSQIKSVSSSLTSPIEIEEWGNAAKFSTAEQKYYTVPIRILSVETGIKAETTVKNFMKNNNSYSYNAPEKNCVWVTAEYEISLDGFPLDEGGTDLSIVSFVTGTDGKSIQYQKQKYSVTTINITDGKYYYEGIHKGIIAFSLPEKYTDYTIILGEYGETQAYFSQSNKKEFEL